MADSKRRWGRWLAVGLVVVVATGAVLGWFVAAPWYAEAQLRAEAEARGIQLELGSLTLAGSGMVLEDVRGNGRGMEAACSQVVASISWLQLLGGARDVSALQGMASEGCVVEVGSVAALRGDRSDGRTGEGEGSSEPTGMPRLVARRISLQLKDDAGVVASYSGDASFEGGRLRLENGQLSLDDGHVQAEGLAGEFEVEQRLILGLQVEAMEASLGAGALRARLGALGRQWRGEAGAESGAAEAASDGLGAAGSDESEAVEGAPEADEARDSVEADELGQAASSGDADDAEASDQGPDELNQAANSGEGSDSGEADDTPEEAAGADSGEAGGSGDAAGADSGEAGGSGDAAGADSGEAGGSGDAAGADVADETSDGTEDWLAFLSPDAEIAVASLVAKDAEGESLLDGLSLAVQRTDAGLRLTGDGNAAGGGTLRWDFVVEPETLRGSGELGLTAVPVSLFRELMPDVPGLEANQGRVSAELTVAAESADELRLEGTLGFEDLVLSHPRLAATPVRQVAFELEGNARFFPLERRLDVGELRLTMGEASLRTEGEIVFSGEQFRIDAEATMPATRCNDAVAAIPQDLLGEMVGFSWRGNIGGRLRIRIDSENYDDALLRVRVANGCSFETVPPMADLRRFEAPFIHRVREPDDTFFEMMAGPGSANWASMHGISPFFVHAVLAHEDAGFLRHDGFAVYAIRDALVRNLRRGRYVSGASTISMQLAKNLFLHREKTLARKVQEVFLTWWLESALEKQAILELYLNVIEYGPAVYGIVQAAEYYFGRLPSELSPAESALLAVILPNPKAFHERFEDGRLRRPMRNRIARFLRHLHARGRIDATALAFGLAEVESFAFHRPGAEVPERQIPGTVSELPFATAGVVGDIDALEEGYEDVPFDEVVPL